MPSDKNPFRHRAASSSGLQLDDSGPSERRRSPSTSPDLPERPEDPDRFEPPPLPPRGSRSEPHLPADDLISEDLPPAYTPAPDVLHGEATIELGPRRPFQQPQAVPQHYLSPASQEWQRGHRPSASVGEWGQYPAYGGLAIPRHTSLTRDRPRTAPSDTIPPGPLSDFARDFYTAGGGNARAGAEAEDDGRPTATPKPGHPLMRNGRVLVYPAFYECRRCTSAKFSMTYSSVTTSLPQVTT